MNARAVEKAVRRAVPNSDRERRHREEIKARLRIACGSLVALALRHGYDRTAVSVALLRPWPQVESIIAAALKVKPWVLWPDRYTRDRLPKGPRREAMTGKADAARNR